MSIEYKGPLNKLGARYFNAPGFPQYLADLAHISNAMTVPASAKIVHIVGQVGANDDYTVSTDPRTEFRQVFENTAKVLKAAGIEEGWNAVYDQSDGAGFPFMSSEGFSKDGQDSLIFRTVSNDYGEAEKDPDKAVRRVEQMHPDLNVVRLIAMTGAPIPIRKVAG